MLTLGFSLGLAADSAVQVAKNGTYEVVRHANITYGQGQIGSHWQMNDVKVKNLTLDYYEPKISSAGLKPAMLVIHGGAYWTGDKSDDVIVKTANYYASAGWATFCIDYRLTGDSGQVPKDWPHADRDNMTWIPTYFYPAVRDAKAAVRWLRANAAEYGVDVDKITAFGESAGAVTTVALALTFESDYKDEISIQDDPTLASTYLDQSSRVATALDHWGSDDAARQLSERDHRPRYNSNNTPLAIFHGTADGLVPYTNALQLDAGYNSTGRPHALYPIPDAGHGCWDAPTADGRSQYDVAYDYVVKIQNLIVVS